MREKRKKCGKLYAINLDNKIVPNEKEENDKTKQEVDYCYQEGVANITHSNDEILKIASGQHLTFSFARNSIMQKICIIQQCFSKNISNYQATPFPFSLSNIEKTEKTLHDDVSLNLKYTE